MSAADLLVDGFPHGTPTGYQQGCRSNGGCPAHTEHGQSCKTASVRYQGDFTYRKRVDAGLTLSEILAFDVEERNAAKVAEVATRQAERAAAREATKPKKPARPRERKTKPARKVRSTGPATPRHGSIERYWDGCFKDCPATPSCADANLAMVNGEPLPTTKEPKPAKTRTPRAPGAPRVRTPRNGKHGTDHFWQKGCRKVEDCPNTAVGLPSCSEVHRAYHREYTARRKAGEGPPLRHGTPTGYQLGCNDRTKCPGGPDGVTCSDAALDADRRRRRRAGRPEATAKADSARVIAHIKYLRSKGMSVKRIYTEAGVARNFVRYLVNGRDDYVNGERSKRWGEIPKKVDRAKAAKVLALKPTLKPRQSTAKHGTRMGYRYLGCKSWTDCPAVASGAKSCGQIVSEYQRGIRERAKARVRGEQEGLAA